MSSPEVMQEECAMSMQESAANTKRLLPVKNLRTVWPRTCATCKCGSYDGNGFYVCSRPDGPSFEVGDGEHHEKVCDRHIAKD